MIKLQTLLTSCKDREGHSISLIIFKTKTFIDKSSTFLPLTVTLIIISFSSPTLSFIPDLKPSFSANPSHRSLSFTSSGLTTWIPQKFTVTSEYVYFYFLVFLFYNF